MLSSGDKGAEGGSLSTTCRGEVSFCTIGSEVLQVKTKDSTMALKIQDIFFIYKLSNLLPNEFVNFVTALLNRITFKGKYFNVLNKAIAIKVKAFLLFSNPISSRYLNPTRTSF
jgi:hypothetical protein